MAPPGVGWLACVRQALIRQGVTGPAMEIIINSWRTSTMKQYQTYVKKWLLYSKQNKCNVFSPILQNILDLFVSMHTSGSSYSAISTARSALSSFINIGSQRLGSHPLVTRFITGFTTPNHQPQDIHLLGILIQKLFSSENEPSFTGGRCLPDLDDCFNSFVMTNTYPLVDFCMLSKSRYCSVCPLCAVKSDSNIHSFKVNILSDKSIFCPSDNKYLITISVSQMDLYLGVDGLAL